MVFAVIYIIVIALLIATAYFGVKNGKLQSFLKAHPQVPKALVLGYIVFAGCVVFPIHSQPFPLDFQKVYLLAASYGVIALAFAGVFGPGRERMIYIVTFLLTAAGMGCRYLLESGEASNTYNFTLLNIISYLAMIPTGTMIAYHCIVERVRK